jgi:LCP family protein required for cell wall assembly
MPKQKLTKVKIVKITLISILSAVIIVCLAVFIIAHTYINKLNMVSATDPSIAESVELEPEPEDIIPEATDSPEDEILTLEDKIRKNMEENSTPILNDNDVLNILLIGSDTREVGGSGRSDAMIIVSINKRTKKIITTSILRDIYLQIPGKGNNRINSAFAYGGADLLMDTIEQNFKIKIDRYASIDFYSFMDIVDAVGGVTLEVSEEEIPIINEYVRNLNRLTDNEIEKDILIEAGTFLLNGKQALSYARNRYIGSDFERTARQRRVLEQIFMNVKDSSLVELNHLLNVILPKVTTNLTEGEIFSLLLSLPNYTNYALEQWSVPMEGSYSFMRIRGMALIGIDFQANINEIHNRVYGEIK